MTSKAAFANNPRTSSTVIVINSATIVIKPTCDRRKSRFQKFSKTSHGFFFIKELQFECSVLSHNFVLIIQLTF